MRVSILTACVALTLNAGFAAAADRVNQPIDTNKLVVQPSQYAANLASQTIQIAGNSAAETIKKDGFVKTFNNLFKTRTKIVTPTQPGGLPSPYIFPSTQYKSFNTPEKPIFMPTRR
jgi:hypothetical protein